MAALEEHEHTSSSLPDHGHARRPACRGVGNKKKEKGREEEENDRGKNIFSLLFSLLNRLQPVRGVLCPNFTEPECLLAKCSKVGVGVSDQGVLNQLVNLFCVLPIRMVMQRDTRFILVQAIEALLLV